jgi:rRNA-processing protein FCF1
VVVVDVANVMGARPDGWWRDRAGSAARLHAKISALAEHADNADLADEWVLVLEGQARAAATDDRPRVRTVAAPGSGDDTIVRIVAEIDTTGESCLVVTADRELRRRCEALRASVVGPGWLLRLL